MALKEKTSGFDKLTELAAKNWYLLWIAILASTAYTAFTMSDIAGKYDMALSKIDAASKGVVMLDYSGRVIYVDKRTIDSTNNGFKSAVSNALRFYILKDWTTLSKNFKVLQIKTPEDIEKNNADVMEFKENYLSKEADIEADYLAWLKMLSFLITRDNLPEKMLAIESSVASYAVDKNHFNITLNIQVVASAYMMESDKTIDKSGEVIIKAEGVFDPEKGNAINPLGIFFTRVVPTYITKR